MNEDTLTVDTTLQTTQTPHHARADTNTNPLADDTTAAVSNDTLSGALTLQWYAFRGNQWVGRHDTVHFVGMGGDPVPYKLSNDVIVTATLLACLCMAVFVVSRSLHALALQVKNFFHNRDRNETMALKSEGEVKHQFFVVPLQSFVLSLLFFSYTGLRLADDITFLSPYMLLLADMAVCLAYFILKHLVYALFNWTFFDADSRAMWHDAYNLVAFAKALFMLMLVLVVLYVDLPPEVCICAFLVLLATFELLILYKTKQIFFNGVFGLFPTILYFCTLELLPLLMLWVALVKMNEYLIC